jgi:hypothetical protein
MPGPATLVTDGIFLGNCYLGEVYELGDHIFILIEHDGGNTTIVRYMDEVLTERIILV